MNQAHACPSNVLSSWEIFTAKTIRKFFKPWVKVLDLMLKDNGGNHFAEKVGVSLPMIPLVEIYNDFFLSSF